MPSRFKRSHFSLAFVAALTSPTLLADALERDSSNLRMIAQPNQIFRYPVISWVAAGAWAEAVEPYPLCICLNKNKRICHG